MKQINRLRGIIDKQGNFPFVIFDLKNIFYLTGFKGSSGYLVIDKDNAWFITDSRYEEYARKLLTESGIDFVLQTGVVYETFKELVKNTGWKKIYVEDHFLTLEMFNSLSETVSAKVRAGGNPCRDLRVVKDSSELALLRKAASITDNCMDYLCNIIKPGLTEWDVAVELEHYYRTHGATGSSFDPIVASGANSSMPHYETSMTKKIVPGDTLLIDMGCVYEGYNSDLTRTLFVGDISVTMREVYGIVNSARQAAIDSAIAGATTGELDSIARKIISDAGYGESFGHSLGHGVGLDVHEHPRVKGEDDFVLPSGSVITIEPGIYIPGTGGVRIEDLLHITDNGPELLSSFSREIRII
ncbi:MAG: aminopeptidase P family protein [Spirochaetes bacterium]|nr:aminopeptidase P family protein [Spirochaetota bacterium]MBN2769637.1 aminopeptidase P family protein [Spirochaetota bacterium]